MSRVPVALQLYTVRDVAAGDFVGTLKQVAEMGYEGVEFASTYGMEAGELKKIIDDLGLGVAGAHVGKLDLTENLQAAADYYGQLGAKYLVTSGLTEKELQATAEGWKEGAKIYEEIGANCKELGFRFAYHNHSFEFVQFDGKYALDIFYDSSDSDLVKGEVDVYWVQHGNECPVEFLKRHGDRSPLIHIKDMVADDSRTFTEVGTGIIDFAPVFDICESTGAEWYIIEQDRCKGSSIESARTSLESMKKWGKLG
ncbi:MAG: sugar phosphate isomerase/epimerase [Planctomycetota bacterium]|nr:sugar phosphate isomerase/epimerase [Planctomycetota bacterium]